MLKKHLVNLLSFFLSLPFSMALILSIQFATHILTLLVPAVLFLTSPLVHRWLLWQHTFCKAIVKFQQYMHVFLSICQKVVLNNGAVGCDSFVFSLFYFYIFFPNTNKYGIAARQS